MDDSGGGRPGLAAGRRGRALLTLGAAAALAHLVALSGLAWAWRHEEPAPGATRPVQVRALAQATLQPGDPPTPAVATPARDVPREAPTEPGPLPPAVRGRPSARPAEPRASTAFVDTKAAPGFEPLALEAAAGGATEIVDDEPAPPSYRTLVPPPVALRYQLRRGAATGTAELQWRVDAAGTGYELGLQARIDGALALAQSSEGRFDAAGVAPLRFVDRRASRAAVAANFQRDEARITFSRKAAAAVLRPGSQDRLSWMLQLPAIVGAEAGLREPGAEVRMNVASAGGDVAVWAFRCEGIEWVETDIGGVETLKYARASRGPYDTRVDVWLDPRRHHLPVQVRWKSGPADDGYALRLLEAPAGP